MKSISKYLMSALVVLLAASCQDAENEFAGPQAYPKEDAITVPGFTASSTSAIDLATDAASVDVFNLSDAALPEGFALGTARIVIEPTDVEAEATEIATDVDGMASVADLQALVESTYGKRPVNRAFKAQVYVDAIKDGQAFLIDAGVIDVNLTPKAPFIASAYYLVGDMVGWDDAGMVKFAHSDADVYEDPVFTIMFTTNGANKYWKIIPQTNIDNGVFWAQGKTGVVGVAVDGDPSMSGTLTTDAPQAGKIENPGMYKMTINMMDYSYTIEPVAPQYYIVGAIQGWSDSKKTHLFTPVSSTELSYTTKWTGAWDLKFWNSNDFGNWANAYGCTVDGDNSASGSIIGTGAQAISAPSAEYYTFTIDMANMKYTWTKLADQNPTEYSTIGLIGDFNGWSGDVAMEQIAPHNWYVVATVADGTLKFRANSDWTVSWGADLTVSDTDFHAIGSTNKAPNINVPAGTYAFYLNDITNAIQIVKQ